MFAKAVLVAALVLTNLAPLSNLPLTPRGFSASGSAVNQSILRPSEIRLHVISCDIFQPSNMVKTDEDSAIVVPF